VVQEITGLKPADAAQARIAAQLITTRELANTFTVRAQAANLEFNQFCRLGSIAIELLRSAAVLDRTLARHQQMPTPFFGAVILDELDIPALATTWATAIPAAAETASPTSASTDSPTSTATTPPPATQPAAAPDPVAPPPAPQPEPPPLQAQREESTDPATPPDQAQDPSRVRPAGANWVIEPLDQGPGWSREVLRRRSATDPVPEPAA
jgi:hypothetical protein